MADASKFFAKADEALKKRNYDYAIQMYQSGLEVDPGNAEGRLNYRIALVRKYDAEGYPKSLGLGALKTIAMSKNPERMLVEAEKMVQKDPKSAKYNIRVAENLLLLKHNEAALTVLEFAAKWADPKSEKLAPQLYSMLAKSYSDAGRTDDAGKLLSRAMRMAPNDKTLQSLAKEIAAKGYHTQFSTAKSSYELVKNRDEADVLEKLRKGVLTEEDADKLLAELEKQLSENPLDRRAVRNIAEILAKRKKFLEAFDRLHKFLEVDPSATEIGDIAAKYKNMYFDLAIQTCTKRAELEPDKAEAWKAKANQLRDERRKFGLEEFGRQVEAAPTDLEKRFNYGKVLFEAGNPEEAFKQFQKAKGSPKYSKLANMFMGQCLLKMDRLEMAEMAFQAVEKEISDGDEDLRKDLMYFESVLLERKGDKAGALNRFRELYMEDMDFRDVEKRIDALKKDLNGAE